MQNQCNGNKAQSQLRLVCTTVTNNPSSSITIAKGPAAATGHLWLCFLHAAKSLQACPTLCDPIDGSPPGSPVPGILQARTLEWVAMSFSNEWKWSCVWLLATPWIAAHQGPLSMGFSRQEYWSGVPLPSLFPSYTFLIPGSQRKEEPFFGPYHSYYRGKTAQKTEPCTMVHSVIASRC